MTYTLAITRLGARGEGLAETEDGRVFIPYALPGDLIRVDVRGERGHLLELLTPSPDRVAPFCPYYAICGGCAVQALAPKPYAEWKRGLVADALRNAGVQVEVAQLIDAHGEGRRRATFHARSNDNTGRPASVGFMEARAHRIVEIEACPILAPSMAGALPAARAIAAALSPLRKPLDICVTATEAGLDVDLRGPGALSTAERRSLMATAERCDLARLANHGEGLIARRAPRLTIGAASVAPPPGAFLQATEAGERVLAQLVGAGVGEARRVADLFAGTGAFALRLAAKAPVHAVEMDAPALDALVRAARATPVLRPISNEARDLFRRPLAGAELDRFDAVVFDPPRAGAPAQAEALAASNVPCIVAVSCSPASFARDAGLLLAGGYGLDRVTPVDQFRHSPHVELVATFSKAVKKQRNRRLLG